MQRKNNSCKPIDLIYQWDVISPSHWEANDSFESDLIFKVGSDNPATYRSGYAFAKKVPLTFKRITEYPNKGYR